MASGKVRVGIIGAGRIAGMVHVPSLKLWPDACEVRAVASRDAGQAKAFADAWAIPCVHPDWRALLADPDLDAVVVCPPSGLTAAVAMEAVAAGSTSSAKNRWGSRGRRRRPCGRPRRRAASCIWSPSRFDSCRVCATSSGWSARGISARSGIGGCRT